ncbi:MAG: hypothetical protein GHCLOJNM_01626 [bacterium]|nr:hypothetical protein [bacterium]
MTIPKVDWKDNMLTLRSPRIPDGAVEVWYLEAFCRKGSTDRDWKETVIPHSTRRLFESETGGEIRLESRVEPSVAVSHRICPAQDGVEFHLEIRNEGTEPADVEWAQPCIRVGDFTGHGQADYHARCFIFTDKGLTTLDDTHRAVEARYRGGQVYVPKGIDLRDVNPRPISSDVPASGLIGCYSSDGASILATAWSDTQELFQGVIVCIHSDFRIGGLGAGELKTLFGKVYLMENQPEALQARFMRDFPNRGFGKAR